MNNGENKTVSVIVPVYNVQEYLEECLKSILNQTYTDLQILAVNDGSTDRCAEILWKYAEKDSRITVLNKTNGGLSDARNYGIEHACGDYIAFIDSDDTIHPQMIGSMIRSCEENHAEISVCDMEYHFPDGTVKESSGGDFTCSSIRENPSLIRINNSACNKLFRRELFADIRFPVGRYYEDLAVIPSILYRADRVAKVNSAYYYYRQRSGSIAHTASPKIFDIYTAVDDAVSYVKEHGNEAAVLEEIRHLYIIHGLDLTTLRIKDFDDKEVRTEYLRKNMERLKESYPEYREDSYYRKADFRKKMIWFLLEHRDEKTVLKLYDR